MNTTNLNNGVIFLVILVVLFAAAKCLDNRLRKRKRSGSKAKDPLDKVLLHLTDQTPITIRMATEGVFCCAELGWGKTFLVFQRFLRAYLRAGMGVYILGAKAEDLETVKEIFRKENALDRLTIIGPKHGQTINWLENLVRIAPAGSETEEVVGALTSLMEISQRSARKSGGEDSQFFKSHAMQLAACSVTVLRLAGEKLHAPALYRFMTDLPSSLAQLGNEVWQNASYSYKCMLLAYMNANSIGDKTNQEHAELYLFKELAAMNDRTRSSVIATFSSMLSKLLRGWMQQLWSTTTTVMLEGAFEGHCYYFDTSPLEYGEYGSYSLVMAKDLIQRIIMRRPITPQAKPVAIMGDEFQGIFVTSDRDFQAVCRQKLGCTWAATQNMTGLYSVLGGDHSAESQVKSWLALMSCKIFGTNSDWATNTYASELCGQQIENLGSGNIQNKPEETMWDQIVGNTSETYGWSEHYHPVVRPEEFVRLRKPEPPTYEADAIVVMPRLQSTTGRHWTYATLRPEN